MKWQLEIELSIHPYWRFRRSFATKTVSISNTVDIPQFSWFNSDSIPMVFLGTIGMYHVIAWLTYGQFWVYDHERIKYNQGICRWYIALKELWVQTIVSFLFSSLTGLSCERSPTNTIFIPWCFDNWLSLLPFCVLNDSAKKRNTLQSSSYSPATPGLTMQGDYTNALPFP